MEVLVSKGYRTTASRKAIVNLLLQRQGGFTVEALCDELTSVSRATVYRTIKLFLEAGVVCKLAKTDRPCIYIICGVGHHHHSVCLQCGSAEEIRATALEPLIAAISADISAQIIDHRVELYVTCECCSTTGEG